LREVTKLSGNIIANAVKALENLDTKKIVGCYCDDFKFEDLPSNQVITDRENLRAYYEQFFSLPDVRFSGIKTFGDDKYAAIEWTWSGRKGDKGEEYSIRGASIIEIQGGRIKRETIYYDPRAFLPT
jgi:steroid delta-isomerase-like uncharacterized protein